MIKIAPIFFFNLCARIKNTINQWHITHPSSIPLICEGCEEAGANPGWLWVRGRVHPGQVTYPSQA